MQTLTFEQLRIKLTETFDNLQEFAEVEIVKRGKIVGYIVRTIPALNPGISQPIQEPVDCKAEYDRGYRDGLRDADPVMKAIMKAKNKPCDDMPEGEKSVLAASGEAVSPASKPVFGCNFFRPQPKATKERTRTVPPATRAPEKPINPELVSVLSDITKGKGRSAHAPGCSCMMCKSKPGKE